MEKVWLFNNIDHTLNIPGAKTIFHFKNISHKFM